MNDSITAWQCIGCGNLEAPQTCIGVCEYRKVRLIDARVCEQQQREFAALRAFVMGLATTHPRADAFEASYLALQRKAGELLNSLKTSAPLPAAPTPHARGP